MHGSHVLHFWCKMQDRIATSSAVAELKASCKGYSELLQLFNIAAFCQTTPKSLSHGLDASACKGVLLRQGAGPLKHLDIRQLWVQEVIRDYSITVVKISRAENLADFLCSPRNECELAKRITEFGFTHSA